MDNPDHALEGIVNLILTAALAALAGLTWNWTTGNAPMSYWLMGTFYGGATLGAELLERAWDWRTARRKAARNALPVPARHRKASA